MATHVYDFTPVLLRKVPIMEIARVMNEIQNTPPLRMVWFKGKILSTTLPSSFMKF